MIATLMSWVWALLRWIARAFGWQPNVSPSVSVKPAEDSEKLLDEWKKRFELIEVDLQNVLLRRHVFKRLQEIVAGNPALHKPSYLYEYLSGTYVASAAVAVRRHARHDGPDDASFLSLLLAIRRKSEVLTRLRHVAFYQEVGMDPDIAEKEFDKLAEPGAAHLQKKHVQRDLDELHKAADELEQFATKRIAHLDLKGPAAIPTHADLDQALDVFEALVRRYRLLLLGQGGDVVPTIAYPWETVLTIPWIT